MASCGNQRWAVEDQILPASTAKGMLAPPQLVLLNVGAPLTRTAQCAFRLSAPPSLYPNLATVTGGQASLSLSLHSSDPYCLSA